MRIVRTNVRIFGNNDVSNFIQKKLKSISINDKRSFATSFYDDYEDSKSWYFNNVGSNNVYLSKKILLTEFILESEECVPDEFVKKIYKELVEIDEFVEIEVIHSSTSHDSFGAMVLKNKKISQKQVYGLDVPQSEKYENLEEYNLNLQMFIEDVSNKHKEYLKICHENHEEYEYEWV